jgi:Alpha/beta hydrolase family
MNSRTAISLLMALSIMKDSVSFQARSINFVQPLIQQGLSSTIDAMRKNLNDSSKVYQPPQNAKSKRDLKGSSALVFVPGCSVKPEQYESLVQSIQQQSDQNLWVIVPSVPMGAANPLTIRHVIKDSIEKLRSSGYSGENTFLGGHSLGAAFLPSILDEFKNEVAGLVMLGSFVTRDTQNVVDSNKVPTLTLCGELDGLVRTSRIAESYHHAITSKGDTDEAKLNNPVVLIEGMNHFQYVNGEAPYMKRVRDLKAEIDDTDALEAVGSTLAQFVDCHSRAGADDPNTVRNDQVRRVLLHKVTSTGAYLKPLIQAMQLEGNPRVAPIGGSPMGSPWTQCIQDALLRQLSPQGSAATQYPVNIESVVDEFHDSWYLKPFDKIPFFHPKIDVKKSVDGETKLALTTCTEAVYDKLDEMLDTGFFSNTCVELRAKLTSSQAAQLAMGHENVPYEEIPDIAGKMNDLTIQWALENAPQSVRTRYLQRGVPLVTGKDAGHKTGPGWIWSSLSLRRDVMKDPVTAAMKDCTVVGSHTMSTPVDHPVPFAGGKMYCKLLSPARAMEYIYTDSLRPCPVRETWKFLVPTKAAAFAGISA